jgi:hypothetical protein
MAACSPHATEYPPANGCLRNVRWNTARWSARPSFQ